MKTKFMILCTAALFFLTACSEHSEDQLAPLMGLSWFADMAEVKDSLNDLELVEEREDGENEKHQFLIDYENAELFELDCTLTVCCTNQGFVGLNYHDTERLQNYRQWYEELMDLYGAPTEQGSGMASWYENPLGKNTSVYLFNLEEGVQVSFYATSTAPDKDYKRPDDSNGSDSIFIPTPEIRTPIVPVTEPTASDDEADVQSTHSLREGYEGQGNVYTNADGVPVMDVVVTDTRGSVVTDTAGNTVTTAVPVVTTSAATKNGKPVTTSKSTDKADKPVTTKAVENPAIPNETATTPVDHTEDFLLNGLAFYNSPTSERSKMSGYTQLYEYRTEEPGQPWELIMEYDNVPYLDKRCDAVLCFTSLGLVGVNYFDDNTDNFNFWINKLTDIYGSPNETQYDYAAWSKDPVGSGTMIYVFALEDGVQISFFADDSGSELA